MKFWVLKEPVSHHKSYKNSFEIKKLSSLAKSSITMFVKIRHFLWLNKFLELMTTFNYFTLISKFVWVFSCYPSNPKIRLRPFLDLLLTKIIIFWYETEHRLAEVFNSRFTIARIVLYVKKKKKNSLEQFVANEMRISLHNIKFDIYTCFIYILNFLIILFKLNYCSFVITLCERVCTVKLKRYCVLLLVVLITLFYSTYHWTLERI